MVMLLLGWKWTLFLVVSLVFVVARGFRLRRGECGAPLLFGAGERVTPLLGADGRALCSKSLGNGACSGGGAGATGGDRMASSAESAASLLLRGLQLRHQYSTATTKRNSMRSTEITAMLGGVELHGFCGGPLLVPPLELVVFVAGKAACVGTCCEMYGVDEVTVVVSGVDGW